MQTILITGSTDGIGKLAAIKLAKAGHQLIIHGRSHNKLENTVAEIKAETATPNITGVVADLSDLGTIQTMVAEIQQKFEHIDVLLNNAGVFHSPSDNTNGLDIRFVVNYLAPYVLTHQLLPLLEKAASPRVINLSSAAQSSVSLASLKGQEELDTQEAYAQSKLALTMWSFYLAQNRKNLTTIAVNPGSLLNTKMVQEAYGQYWSSAEKGAQILYELATDRKHTNNSGQYFNNDEGRFSKAHPDAYSPRKIEELIATTNTLVDEYIF